MSLQLYMATHLTYTKQNKMFDFHFLDSRNEIKPYNLIAEGRISEPNVLSKIYKYNLHSVVGKALQIRLATHPVS